MFQRAKRLPVPHGLYGSNKFVAPEQVVQNGVAVESANAEQPQGSHYEPGDTVDFTDSGDGSGTGVYLRKDGTGYTGASWIQIG